MRNDMDFAEAERFLQRAFVIRARTFGIEAEETAAARTNLLKCYIAQNKTEEMKEIRDHVKSHLLLLERTLADFETDLRKARLRAKIKKYALGVGAEKLEKMRDAADSLGLHASPRKLVAPTDVPSPPRFHGHFADNRLIEYHHLKGSTSAARVETMVYPQHQAGARQRQRQQAASPTREELPRPHIVGGAPPPASQLPPSRSGITTGQPSAAFRRDAAEQLQLANYTRAADSCRQGLVRDAGDAALRAMFRASLGKLAEYPRRDDFDATVVLRCKKDAILGEPITVHYDYKHNRIPNRRHPRLDWLGLFKVCYPHQRSSCSC